MNILKQTNNPILKRKEIEATMESSSNPGFQKVTQLLAEELKAPAETIVLRAVRGNFGTNQFLIEAFIYENVQDKERIEPKKKVKKKVEGAA